MSFLDELNSSILDQLNPSVLDQLNNNIIGRFAANDSVEYNKKFLVI